jgi:4-amino-4-deoxy-L-arabinose transferase-like glycosyltransferase
MFTKIFVTIKTRKWEFLLLFAIIGTGVFLRTYHFSDWLLFEIDQTYDARIVSQAIESGPGELPLLGPTAGGGRALRLGPAFYYLEYVSALVFGDTPVGHAMLVLLSSIGAIPLFYLFARRYFGVPLALSLAAIFSGSVYLVLYGRFSWSPNVLPFLVLLSFYALLRSASPDEPRRDRYFLIATAAVAITSQIHFNAFFTIPTIVILFLLYRRPSFRWKTWIVAIGIVLLAYSPMIVNDIITNGENIGFFLKKISKTGEPFKDIVRKSVVTLQYDASGYFFVASGIDHINGGAIRDYGFRTVTDSTWRLLAIALFLIGLISLIFGIVKEKMPEKMDFLVLLLLWVSITSAYFYSLISSGFRFYPRFYLLVAPAAILLLGILLERLHPEKNMARKAILVLVTLTILIPNGMRLFGHFEELAHPGRNDRVETEDVFPNDTRLTLKEQLAITDAMLKRARTNGDPVYLNALHEYEPVFWYHLEKNGVRYTDSIDDDILYAHGNYFLINFPGNGTRAAEATFDISERKPFGALVLYTLAPKPKDIRADRQDPADRHDLEQTKQIRDLATWNDVFGRK